MPNPIILEIHIPEVAQLAAAISAVKPQPITPPANAYPSTSVQQYRQPVSSTTAPQSSTPATAAMPAPTAAPARMPYPSNSAPVNPTYAPTQGAPVTPATARPIAPTFPNATNSAMPAAPVTTSAAPTATPGNAAPTAATPTYDLETLARAAGAVSDAGKRQQVCDLITNFGVPTLSQLPKEHYGEFATALRQMGARI